MTVLCTAIKGPFVQWSISWKLRSTIAPGAQLSDCFSWGWFLENCAQLLCLRPTFNCKFWLDWATDIYENLSFSDAQLPHLKKVPQLLHKGSVSQNFFPRDFHRDCSLNKIFFHLKMALLPLDELFCLKKQGKWCNVQSKNWKTESRKSNQKVGRWAK